MHFSLDKISNKITEKVLVIEKSEISCSSYDGAH